MSTAAKLARIPEAQSDLLPADLFRQQAWIDGAWQNSDTGATFEVTDPATGEVLGTVPDMGAAETKRAIAAAKRAWPAWRGLTAKERSIILRRWFEMIVDERDDLALLMTLEQGKPLNEALGEIDYAASFVEWFAEEAKRIYGDIVPTHLPGSRLVVIRQPVGVTAAITPWNFPSAMITRKAAAAMAAGCPMIVRPASETPYSALALAELAQRAGVPGGVLQVLTGSARAIAGTLMESNVVRKVSFTGSTEVGRILLAQGAATVKKMSMELGGHAPFIVFEDADLDAAVHGAVGAKFATTGQDCLAANRIFVHQDLYEAFAAKFAAATAALKVGRGLDPGVQQGPLMSESALAKVEQHVADAVEKGARVLVGGRRHRLGGLFYEPTVLADVTSEMKIFTDETFGPVAPLSPFRSEEEVVELANDSIYGLASYFYSRDIGRAWRVAEALEYGMVAVNTPKMTGAPIPFGGVKQSGLGREGSKYGIDDYTEIKYISMGGIGA